MSVTFWPQRNPGVAYVRCELPAKALAGEVRHLGDWLVAHDDTLGPEFLDNTAEGTSVWQMPANGVRQEAIKRWQAKRGPVFVEVDDDYTRWDEAYGRFAGRWSEHRPFDDRTSSPAIHCEILESADGVIASTPHLAEVCSAFNGNVQVCRNGIDAEVWPEPPERDTFTVLFAGAPNDRDLVMVRRAMEWAGRQEGVQAATFGWKSGWAGVKTLGWVNDMEAFRAKLVAAAPDVGLRPLQTTEFSRSKSDLKILEYAMAQAMPFVQAWEPYMEWRGSELVGFGFDAKDWEKQVKWAVGHPSKVREYARLLRERVIAVRGLDCVRTQWSVALASV